MTNETTHNVNESADKIRVETKVKRGSGTRDQDEIKVQIKGDDPDDVVDRLNATVQRLRQTAGMVRDIQPDGDSDGE